MVVQRHILQSTLAILILWGVALGSQGRKQAPKMPDSPPPGVTVVPAGCPLSEQIAADQAQSHESGPAKRGSVFQTLSPQKLFSCLSPSVMVVESLDAKGSVIAFGSGVVIGSDHVITNRHVIEEGVSFRVEHGGKGWPAKLIRVDPDHDLAELSVPELPDTAQPVVKRDSSTLAVGEKVYAIGAPEGLELTISEGLVSGLRDLDKDRIIQTSAAISPGSSGGGLFDAQGRLVGITTFYLKEGQSLNFALPAEWTLALDRQPIKPLHATGDKSPAFQALVWFVVGYKADQAGNQETAVRAYGEATRQMPNWATPWANLGTAYGKLGRFDKAVAAEQRAILLNPELDAAWISLGFAYDGLGRYANAVSAYREAVRIKPSSELAWANMGTAYGRLGQFQNAVSAERMAIALKPDSEEAWGNLCSAYNGQKDHEKAINSCQRAIRINPHYANAWIALGIAYSELKQYRKALTAIQEALRVKPEAEIAWIKLGVCYAGLGKYGRAAGALQEAARLKPDDAEAWFKLGIAQKLNKQPSAVTETYQKLKRLDPKLAEQLFQAAILPQ
jgi:tetratricopeptide (TPR) repeat protein